MRGLVRSQRGAEGGYWLARPPEEITLAEVIRGVEGPIANVRGEGPAGRGVHRLRRAPAKKSGSPSAPTCARCSRRSRSPTWLEASFRRAVEELVRDPDAWRRAR